MARPLRIEFPGAVYHITSRGNEKKEIFGDDQDRKIFLNIFKDVILRYNWFCHAYCLMENHYHLLIDTPEGNLSISMRQLNGIYTQNFNKRHNRVGHLFQGRFKAVLIQKESHLLEVCRYVVLNPVRAEMVQRPEEWNWSSYGATSGLKKPHACLVTNWVLSQFGSEREVAEAGYRKFVREGIGAESIWNRVTAQSVLIYERDFLGFSYGFRPGKGQHSALDALSVGIMRKKVSWVLEADIRSFFETLKHEWLVRFVEHRIADRRIVRLIQKWLNAGVLEEGKRIRKEEGTVQGGSISPLLSNIYLHYVFDLWVHWWRRHKANGEVIVVRFADDWVAGFQYQTDAQKFLRELKGRFARFGLELHSEKTRLIEFGRFAAQSRAPMVRENRRLLTFSGFTHICGRTRQGKFTVLRKTMRKKWQNKLKEISRELRNRMHRPVPEQGAYVRSVLLGHMRYYGVPMNGRSLSAFRHALQRVWWKVLRRRSQKHNLSWKRMERLIEAWFPSVRIFHPYPSERVRV